MKNFKQKWENYWYYYKVPTILVIIFIFGAVMFFSAREDYSALDGKVSIVTTGVISSEQINFDEYVKDKVEDLDGDGYHALSINELWLSADGSQSSDVTTIQQVLASFSSGDTGLYIFDKANLDRFIVYDAFEPLENVLASETLEAHETVERDGTAYAISLKGIGLIENHEFNSDELYAAVIFDRPLEDTDEETKALADSSKVLLAELLK